MDRREKQIKAYVLFQRSNRVANDRTVKASAKIVWKDIVGLGMKAKSNEDNYEFDENAIAWVSHPGCNIQTFTDGATESTAVLWVTCKDVIQMAKSILTTKQPGREEIALLAPYR